MVKMSGHIKDRTGERYDRWTVLSFLGVRTTPAGKRMANWLCKCSCGIVRPVRSDLLNKGLSRSCGCSRLDPVDDITAGVRAVANSYRNRATKYKTAFTLTVEDIRRLILGPCHYCGVKSSCSMKIPCSATRAPLAYNGIDRVDNFQGYTKANTVTCCIHCNIAKNDRTLTEFTTWVIALYNNMNRDEAVTK